MHKIKKLKDRLFGKFKKHDGDTYKDIIYKAVKARDIEKLTQSLQELECINPQQAIEFLQDVLTYLANNSEGHKDKMDMFDNLQDTIDTMMSSYDRNFPSYGKENEIRAQKLENIKSNFRMLTPHILENKEKVQKNGKIQDILESALERFLECRQPYPEILRTIFKTIAKRDVEALKLIIEDIGKEKENESYVLEQIKTSYTLLNLTNEIKRLKSYDANSKAYKKHMSLLDVDIKVWDLLKGLEIDQRSVEKYNVCSKEKDLTCERTV